jgi:hypothetical protein
MVWFGMPSLVATYAAYDAPISLFVQACVAVFLFLSLRRVYGAGRWYCTTISLLIAWAFFHIVWFYRFVLFEITLRVV